MSNDHSRVPRATKVQGRGSWKVEAADSVLLDSEDRHHRRLHMVGTGGLQFLLDLPEAVHLRGGDALELEDSRLIEVVAAPEMLVEVRAADPQVLARLAWHIGNRHVPVEITKTALRIRADKGLEAALEALGAKLRPIETSFEPEGGAYAAETHAAHGHEGHDHHGHDHHEHDHHGHDHHGHDHHDHDHDHHDHDHHHGHDHPPHK